MKNQKIYLDNAATTYMFPEVIDAMAESMRHNFGNPSSTHFFGRDAKGIIENVRKKIASFCNVTSAEIVFTSCGTESNNLILRSSVDFLGVDRIITSPIEHSCVMQTVDCLEQFKNVTIDYVQHNEKGEIDLDHLESLLKHSDKKTLVSIMHANNEIGNINPIKQIGEIAHQYNALYHSDMVQTLGHYIIDLENLPVDFASSSAHKFHGPKGVGFAYIKKGTGLKAQITGGGQERNMRSGTENLHGVLGMGKAFEISQRDYEKDRAYITDLKQYAINKIKEVFPETIFNGKSDDLENSLYTLISLSLPFQNGMMGFEMDLRGIAVSQGSACQSGAAKASKVLSTILSQETIDHTTPMRVSFSIDNTKEEIDAFMDTLIEIAEKTPSFK
ncbi:aminotransferase class V-fold PLP-dependent enzyme [Flavobacteriaceae bacterium Ap0902]|nr:aminotransferase class V-fold PLP-dependent enzyme [Flavobacteriaceae bacterium Ap0902]